MENKYYTPKMSDFHLGFEFEEKIAEDIWHPRTFLFKWFKEDEILKLLDKNKIRVKHLDQEDIIDLGFSQISDDCFNISNIDYRGRTNCDLRILIRGSVLIYIIDSDDKSHTIFTGTIKNKSELKRLIQQLNILVDGKS